MKPHLKNKICAHPELLIITICFLIAVIVACFQFPLDSLFTNIFGFLAIAALILLIGFMLFWKSTRKICSKVNGAPYQVNEEVLIITGADRNKSGLIRTIEKSQGGWPLLVLEMNHHDKAKPQKIYEEYAVMRIK
jgi:hypothetical protein